MLICFEGAKGTGKTTLAKDLAAKRGIPFWECPKPVEDYKFLTQSYAMFVLDELTLLHKIDWTKVSLVTDRHPYISECVWSEHLNRVTLDVFKKGYFQPWLIDNVRIVHLLRNFEFEATEEAKDQATQQQIYIKVIAMVATFVPVLRIWTDDVSVREAIDAVEVWLDGIEAYRKDVLKK